MVLIKAMKSAPPLMKAGMLGGISAGLALGAMVHPLGVGLVAGVTFGAIIGAASGLVMSREDKRKERRTRELDEIIGITHGSMGTPPKSIPPGDLRRDPETALELESWAREWLTPPPPAVR
jgi:hypothetical protein